MDITIKIFQDYLKERYGGWAKEESLFLKLTEELGEVAEVINKRAGIKSKEASEGLSNELGEELSDMIHYIIAIASINDIDLSAALINKDRKGSKKYDHDTNLETFIIKTQN